MDNDEKMLKRVHRAKRKATSKISLNAEDLDHQQSYDLNINISDDEDNCRNECNDRANDEDHCFPTGTDHESFTASRENLMLSAEN